MQKPTHFLNLFQMLLLLGFWGHVVLEGLVKRHVLLVDCSEADALGPGVNIGVIFPPRSHGRTSVISLARSCMGATSQMIGIANCVGYI